MRAFIKKLIYIKKNQSGFSLVELLVAIAISSIIIIGLVIGIFQLFTGHARASGEMTVVRQVQQAGYYISRDTHMAREVLDTQALVDIDPDTTEVVTLTWYWFLWHENPADRDGEGHRVIYTLENDKLYRNYYFAPEDELTGEVNEDDYAIVSKTFIAGYIDEIVCIYANGELTLTVTASVDGIAGEQEETRIYEAKPRPNVFY